MPLGREPKQLLVLTDMGWDAASGGDMGWSTHLENVKNKFAQAGGWAVPRIVVWNLATTFMHQYHAEASQPGVAMVSGWNSNLLKQFMEGGDLAELSSPSTHMRTVLYSERYQPVLDALRS